MSIDRLYHSKRPSVWNEVILFSCPKCHTEFPLESLDLEKRFSNFYGMEMYFAICPDCGTEHVAFG